MSPEQKVSSCSFVYTQNKAYDPWIIDTGTQFVLSNLPQPWILVCETSQRPFTIPYSTYRVTNHTELCECALSAGYEYQINVKMMLARTLILLHILPIIMQLLMFLMHHFISIYLHSCKIVLIS